ncbi:MAG: hypothetical protein VX444_06000 [Pseudomonadota bacterium]|nr:hypothetical protein [Pseudomonadota bacterium]
MNGSDAETVLKTFFRFGGIPKMGAEVIEPTDTLVSNKNLR